MIKLDMTLQHIKNGLPSDPNICPIALALNPFEDIYVSVNPYAIHIGSVILATSPGIKEWMDGFDQDDDVEPFTLVIDYEEKYACMIGEV